MKKFRLFFILTFVLIFNTLTAQWKQDEGPKGDISIVDLLVKNDYLFASVYAKGIYRSDDNGLTWIEKSSGIESPLVNCIISSGDSILAGTNLGFCYSTDNGDNWNVDNSGLAGLDINDIIKHNGLLYLATESGVYQQSVSGPATWIQINSGLTNIYTNDFLSFDGTLYAATYDGVFKRGNSDSAWVNMSNGLPVNGRINYLEIIDSTMYASSTYTIYKSTDKGENWVKVTYPNVFGQLRDFTEFNNKLYSLSDKGLIYTEDKGVSWVKAVQEPPLDYLTIKSLAKTNLSLIAGTWQGGTFISDANGTNWNSVGPFCKYPEIMQLTIKENNLYALSQNTGVYRKNLDDGNWEWLRNNFFETFTHTIYADENNLFVGGNDSFLSLDFTDTSWNYHNQGLDASQDFKAIKYITRIDDYYYIYSPNRGILKGHKDTLIWSEIQSELSKTTSIYSLTSIDTTLYTIMGFGFVLESKDYGASWNYAGDTLMTGLGKLNVYNNELYSYDIFGIKKLSSQNNKWINLNYNLSEEKISSVAFLDGFIIVSGDDNLYIKADSDTTWFDVKGNLPYSSVDSENPHFPLYAFGDKVYVGTLSSGIWYADIADLYPYVSVDDKTNEVPNEFTLKQNYPNPFNPNTNIEFSIPENGFVNLIIFNSTGEIVRNEINENLSSGNYTVRFDGSSMASGVYYYKIAYKDKQITKKMLLLK